MADNALVAASPTAATPRRPLLANLVKSGGLGSSSLSWPPPLLLADMGVPNPRAFKV